MRQRELVEHILARVIKEYPNLSDCNFTVGKTIQAEVDGILKEVYKDLGIIQLTPFQTEVIALNLIGHDRRNIKNLLEHGSCDLSYHLKNKARFRVNIFSQRGTYSIVMRKLPTCIPTIEELQLPAIFREIAREKNGLVFFTGATGTGKTTSLASILDEINKCFAIHVVTLEDPVEYVHKHQRATFNQRELGLDFDSFANGLRAALRQAPKVIFVGEMRDRETVEIGLSAAETGHLVLTTLHTIDAGQTINRLIGMFETEEERNIRTRLADSLKWVVSQRLVPRIGGGRVAVFEIMGSNLRVKESILHGESEGKTFYEIIESSEPYGWQTFDKCLVEAFKKNLVTEETAMAYASKRSVVKRGVDWIKSQRGEKTTDIDGLKIDREYDRNIIRKDLN